MKYIIHAFLWYFQYNSLLRNDLQPTINCEVKLNLSLTPTSDVTWLKYFLEENDQFYFVAVVE